MLSLGPRKTAWDIGHPLKLPLHDFTWKERKVLSHQDLGFILFVASSTTLTTKRGLRVVCNPTVVLLNLTKFLLNFVTVFGGFFFFKMPHTLCGVFFSLIFGKALRKTHVKLESLPFTLNYFIVLVLSVSLLLNCLWIIFDYLIPFSETAKLFHFPASTPSPRAHTFCHDVGLSLLILPFSSATL